MENTTNELKDLEKRYRQLGEEIEAYKAKQNKAGKPDIDWSKMPVDTLVEVRNRDESDWFIRHFSHARGDVTVLYYCHEAGRNSATTDCIANWKQIRLITNPPRPWFGGKCPVDPNIKVRVWLRDGVAIDNSPASTYRWDHRLQRDDIIAYQILGEDEE